jgi:hypothetical protein
MRQTYEFSFRVPERMSLQTHKIEPGTQQKITGTWSPADIDFILDQHAKYGIVRDQDIDRTTAFSGTCYSIGKPIANARLMYLMNHNLDQLIIQGQEIRKANAIGQSALVERALVENGRPERVDAFDITVQQENEDPKNDIPQFSVGTLVKQNSDARPPRAGKGRRRAA